MTLRSDGVHRFGTREYGLPTVESPQDIGIGPCKTSTVQVSAHDSFKFPVANWSYKEFPPVPPDGQFRYNGLPLLQPIVHTYSFDRLAGDACDRIMPPKAHLACAPRFFSQVIWQLQDRLHYSSYQSAMAAVRLTTHLPDQELDTGPPCSPAPGTHSQLRTAFRTPKHPRKTLRGN